MIRAESLGRWALALVLMLASASRVRAQTSPADTARGSGEALQPGDVIRLKIWREPDLSGDVQVGADGQAVFPKLGPIAVTALSPDSLRSLLLTSYGEYLRNPSIEVTLLRRVNIQGAVRNPGLYPVDPTMTVTDAIALAGGATSDGLVDKAELRRDGQRMTIELTAQTRLADTPVRSGDQLFVPLKSWASRNTGLVAAFITAATSVIVTLLVR